MNRTYMEDVATSRSRALEDTAERLERLVARLFGPEPQGEAAQASGHDRVRTPVSDDQTQALLKTIATLQRERDEARNSEERRFEEIVTLSQLLETTRNKVESTQVQVRKLKQDSAAIKTKGDRAKDAHAKLSVKAKALQQRLEVSQQVQAELVARLQAEIAQSAWQKLTHSFTALLHGLYTSGTRKRSLKRSGKSFPGGAEQLARDVGMLEESMFFDAKWYLEHYPDVAESGALAEVHYLKYGAAELRDPGPLFSTSRYCEMYPDIARSHVNPLIHYIQFGNKERRVIELSQVK